MKISRTVSWSLFGLLLTVGVAAGFVYYRGQLHHEIRRLDLLGRTVGGLIIEGLGRQMMERDLTGSNQLVRSFADVEPISGILLLDRDNVVKASADPRLVGRRFRLDETGCRECHQGARGRYQILTGNMFRWAQPIENKPACQGCHPASEKTNGVLILDFSIGDFRAHVRREIVESLLLFGGAILLISFLMYLVLRKLVFVRLDALGARMRGLEDGEYEAPSPVRGDDELSRLEAGFSAMAQAIAGRDREKGALAGTITAANEELRREVAEHQHAREQIQRSCGRQQAVNLLLALALEEIPLQEILRRALDIILALPWLSLESKGAIFLVEESGQLRMKAARGLDAGPLSSCDTVPLGRCHCGRAAATGEIQFAGGVDEGHDTHYEGLAPHGHYCVPILLRKRVIGVLNLYLRAGHELVPEELDFLASVANALAAVIQRRQAEDEREGLIHELQDALTIVSLSRQEWQDTFDGITEMVSILDQDQTLLKVNRAYADYFHAHPRDFVDRPCGPLPPAAPQAFYCPLPRALAERRPLTEEISDPATDRIFRVTTFPSTGPEGEITRIVHLARDITEEKERELRLIMSERLAMLGQMASGIAHEINNPLASIAGCSEGLLARIEKGPIDIEILRRYLSIIQEETFRCKKITTAMLSFVRKTTYEKKRINLNDLIDRTLEVIGFQGRLAEVEVERRLDPALPPVSASEGEIRQVLLALIVNALDAMSDRGRLVVETREEPGGAVVSIGDTGEGIKPENQEKIFHPFFTTKSDRGGTGLGLSIARRIVFDHQGTLEIASEPGHGTTVKIFLPR